MSLSIEEKKKKKKRKKEILGINLEAVTDC